MSLREILAEVHARLGRPVLVAETGIEGDGRAAWLAYIGEETRAALRAGVPVEGICLYPIVNHPGWDDDRYCENGLFHSAVNQGGRMAHEPLAREIIRQQALFDTLFEDTADSRKTTRRSGSRSTQDHEASDA